MNQLITKLLKIVCFKNEYYVLNITILKRLPIQTKWEPPILGELDTCQAKQWKYTLPISTTRSPGRASPWRRSWIRRRREEEISSGGPSADTSSCRCCPPDSCRWSRRWETKKELYLGLVSPPATSHAKEKNREWDLKSSWILTVCRDWGAKIINFSGWKRVETKTISIFPDL